MGLVRSWEGVIGRRRLERVIEVYSGGWRVGYSWVVLRFCVWLFNVCYEFSKVSKGIRGKYREIFMCFFFLLGSFYFIL